MKIAGKALIVATFACAGALAAADAVAMPIVQGADQAVAAPLQQAGWRCGPGWHMNGWGRCVPNRPWRRGPYWRRW